MLLFGSLRGGTVEAVFIILILIVAAAIFIRTSLTNLLEKSKEAKHANSTTRKGVIPESNSREVS
jgi:hypothetical protein